MFEEVFAVSTTVSAAEKRRAYAREILMRAEGRKHCISPTITQGVYEIPGKGRGFFRAFASVLPPRGWGAVIALPHINWAVAHEYGIELDHLLLVNPPESEVGNAAFILLEGVHVLCLGDIHLSREQKRRLWAKARHNEHLILTSVPWKGISRQLPSRHVIRQAV